MSESPREVDGLVRKMTGKYRPAEIRPAFSFVRKYGRYVVAVAVPLVLGAAAWATWRKPRTPASIVPVVKLAVTSSPSPSASASGATPRYCSVHSELDIQKMAGTAIMSRGAHFYAFFNGPESPTHGLYLLASDFAQRPGGREFEVFRLAAGEHATYVRDLLIPIPDWVGRGAIATVGVDLALDTDLGDPDRMACQAQDYSIGACDPHQDERRRAVCEPAGCATFDERYDSSGRAIATVVRRIVSIRLDDCSVIQLTPN